jgi:hypothetical protein
MKIKKLYAQNAFLENCYLTEVNVWFVPIAAMIVTMIPKQIQQFVIHVITIMLLILQQSNANYVVVLKKLEVMDAQNVDIILQLIIINVLDAMNLILMFIMHML